MAGAKTNTGARLFVSILAVAAMTLVPVVGTADAAGMYHGPAGPSPITGLPRSPPVPFQYGLGMQAFLEKCAACHGQWAEGTADRGPPLIHPFYEPNHHDDDAFHRAVQTGTNQHHWHFGDMPPVEGVTRRQAGGIIQFIRWWQQRNGIR